MFSYNIELAIRSFRRSPGLTALMIMSIALGVAASMITFSVFRAVSGDPIPWKSSTLFVPQIDLWNYAGRDKYRGLPDGLDYAAAMALLSDHRGTLQAAMYKISPSVIALRGGSRPVNVDGHAVSSEFFSMLDVPFKYGAAWSRRDDQQRANAVIISEALNQRLFGGQNSVGETLSVDGRNYRVAGVLDYWNPQPRFFDVVNTGGFTTSPEDIFLPLTTAIDANLDATGNTECDKSPSEPGIAGLKSSSCVWIAYMVQLDNSTAVSDFESYLDQYARQLQSGGVSQARPRSQLRDLPEWLDAQHVVPPDTGVSLLVAFGLLVVCLVNTSGLLLTKFLRRSNEIGMRRAIGAPRVAIYSQFLTEAGLVGLVGGAFGLGLTIVGIKFVHRLLPQEIASLAHVDVVLLALTLLIAVASTLLAGLYPTYRATLVQPMWQLKSS